MADSLLNLARGEEPKAALDESRHASLGILQDCPNGEELKRELYTSFH